MINQEKIVENAETILDELGVSYKRHGNRLSFACPVHSGTKRDGAALYTTGVGIWKCWTNHCENQIGKSFLSLIKGIMSQNTETTLDETVRWLEKFLNISLNEENNKLSVAKHNTINLALSLVKSKNKEEKLISRKDVLTNLQIPAKFFLTRGYLESTLSKYDVGLCVKPRKQMSYRIVAPVYDDSYNYMVGCIGRTQKPQCSMCRKFHGVNESCPNSSLDEYFSSKWINSTGFNGEKYLYNFWFAKEYISSNNTAILVEGAPDVWRLEEADIHLGLGLFGAHLTDSQAEKLEKLPILNLIIATDNDEAGQNARAIIKEKLWRHYNIFDVITETKDVGELSIEQTKSTFYPLLEKLRVI